MFNRKKLKAGRKSESGGIRPTKRLPLQLLSSYRGANPTNYRWDKRFNIAGGVRTKGILKFAFHMPGNWLMGGSKSYTLFHVFLLPQKYKSDLTKFVLKELIDTVL